MTSDSLEFLPAPSDEKWERELAEIRAVMDYYVDKHRMIERFYASLASLPAIQRQRITAAKRRARIVTRAKSQGAGKLVVVKR